MLALEKWNTVGSENYVDEDLDQDDAVSVSTVQSRQTLRSNRSHYSHASTSHVHHTKKLEPGVEGKTRMLYKVGFSSEVMCCRFSEDGSLLAVGLATGLIKVMAASNGAELYALTDQEVLDQYLPCTMIRFRPMLEGDRNRNLLVATYASGMVKWWHVSTSSCLHTTHEPRQTLAVAINNLSDTYVTSGSDDKIYVYDEASRKKVFCCEPSPSMNVMDGHRFRVFAVQFHPDEPTQFISGGWDDTVQFWDTRVQHSIRKFYGPHICGDALDIDRVHKRADILTGSWRKDATLQIWDYSSGRLIKTIPADYSNSLLYCAQWCDTEHILAGGCEANFARVVDRGTLQTTGRLVYLQGGVYCMDNDRQGKHPRIAAGSAQTIYVMDNRVM